MDKNYPIIAILSATIIYMLICMFEKGDFDNPYRLAILFCDAAIIGLCIASKVPKK